MAPIFIAVSAAIICCILLLRRRVQPSERSLALLKRIEDERQRCVGLWGSAMAAPPLIYPAWAKKLSGSIKTDALRVLLRVDRTLSIVKTLAVRDVGVTEILLDEASATLDTAESMISLADVTLDEIVNEERRFAREMLEKVRQIRKDFESYVRSRMDEGLPFQEEVRRVSILENAFKADETAIEGDPRGAMAAIQRQAAYLGSIGWTVHIHVAVHERINELGRILPHRLEEAQATRSAAQQMLADLKVRKPDNDWTSVEDLLRSLPDLFESVEGRIRAAAVLCASKERKLSLALIEAVSAENAMDEIDSRLMVVLETWSESLARQPAD